MAKQDSINAMMYINRANQSAKTKDCLIDILNERKVPIRKEYPAHEQQIFWDTVEKLIKPVKW